MRFSNNLWCRTTVAIAFFALAGCGRADRPNAPPQTRPNLSVPSNRETAQCLADLRQLHVSFQVLPDRETGAGCGLAGTVKLVDIGVPVANLTAVRCGAARAFIGWTRNAVAPAAYQMLGSELARIDSMGSYSCRNIVGSARNANRRSGHAIANAIDIGGFVLKDGRRITVLNDWNSPDPQVRQFLQTMRVGVQAVRDGAQPRLQRRAPQPPSPGRRSCGFLPLTRTQPSSWARPRIQSQERRGP